MAREPDMVVRLVADGEEADQVVGVIGDQVLIATPADVGKVVTVAADGTLVLGEGGGGGADLTAHLEDETDAHDASSISAIPVGALSANSVGGQLAELEQEKAAISHSHVGEFAGVKVTRLSNHVIANRTAFPFDNAEADPDDWWDAGTPTKLVVPAGKAGWYWVGAAITTLGTDYGGSTNINVQIQIAKNWDGVSGNLLNATIVYERFDNSSAALAQGNSTVGLVLLEEGDELELTLVGSGANLLVESNPTDGSPGGFLTDTGPGTLSPHFFAVPATSQPGPQGDPGADGDMTWSGAWSALITYAINQAVEHEGSSYVARTASTNSEPPSAAWDLLAAKGDQGIQGIPGEDGGGSLPAGGLYLKDYAVATRTAGSLTLNQTAITDVDTGLDLVLDAAAGDIIEVGISALLSNVAQTVCFDFYTVVGGSPVNPVGPGLSAGLVGAGGVQGWYTGNLAAVDTAVSGMHPRTLVSGDISGGQVRLRLRYAKTTTTGRTLYAVANNPLTVFAKVWSPFA